MSDLPTIALRIESSTRESRWRELLATVNCRVVAANEPASSSSPVDIVVTDGRQQPETPAFERSPDGIDGVIGIDGELVADVVFADEPTERELRLACELLFEIVKLRRERAISQQKQQLLTEMAELDELTRLANRRAWDAELARRTKRVNVADATLCLALFDLDHFKDVNTTHGYAVADKVLQHVGIALQASVRADDFVARIGGDEFGVLLSNISAERAESAAERIRASIEPAIALRASIAITATAGIALWQQGHDADTLFAAADTNLRHGKSAGRNQTVAEHLALIISSILDDSPQPRPR